MLTNHLHDLRNTQQQYRKHHIIFIDYIVDDEVMTFFEAWTGLRISLQFKSYFESALFQNKQSVNSGYLIVRR